MANRTITEEPTAWVGWIAFGGVMMILDGIFQAIIGLTAIFNPHWFVATKESILLFNLATWGWWNLLLGIVVTLVGFALFSGSMTARVLGVILVGLSLLSNLAWVGAYPLWSLIVITVDVLVIYALIVHGGEMRA
jgi:hypothetical protein